MTYIQHIDLGTGYASRVARADVSAEALREAGELVTDMLRGVPRTWRGYRLTAIATGRCMSVTIARGGSVDARIGVATHSRCAASLWRLLTEVERRCPTLRAERPRQPWVATDMAIDMPDYQAVDALAPALAWAWLDHVRGRVAA